MAEYRTPAEQLAAAPEVVGICVRCGAEHGTSWRYIGLCRACKPTPRVAEVLRRVALRRALKTTADFPHGPAGEDDRRARVKVCTTCGCLDSAPRRVLVDGQVVEGCIGSAHDAYADAWHNRPAAVAFREANPRRWWVSVPADLVDALGAEAAVQEHQRRLAEARLAKAGAR